MSLWESILLYDTVLSRVIATTAMTNEWLRFAAFVAAELLPYVAAVTLIWLWYHPASVAKHHGNRKAVVLAAMAAVVALAFKTLGAAFIHRERPFVVDITWPHLDLSVDPGSFPSAHTMLMVAVAVSVYRSGARYSGIFLGFLALLVAWGRVATGVHFTGDVVVGAVVGGVIALVLHAESSSLKRYLPNT